MSAVKQLFTGAPKPDTSKMDAIRAQQKKQSDLIAKREAEADAEKRATGRTIRGNRFAGPTTLFSLATGVDGAPSGKGKTLGGGS